MATEDSSLKTQASPGLLSDFAGVFSFLMDPVGAAKRLPRKFFWIAPLVIVSIVYIVCGVLNFPLVQQAMMNQPPPPNASPEQFQRGMQIGLTIQKVALFFSPVIFLIMSALGALVILVGALVVGIKARFLELFNMSAGLAIIGALKVIATSVIIHAKGEPSSIADLKPPLGLDIFAPVGMSKVAVALLGFINIFDIWGFVMTVAILSIFYRVKVGRAVIATLPLYIILLLLSLVGAMFSKT